MAMTVVTQTTVDSRLPAQGFRHPTANHAVIEDGHLVLYTHNGGDQVALYPPKVWQQVYTGTKVKFDSGYDKFNKTEEAGQE